MRGGIIVCLLLALSFLPPVASAEEPAPFVLVRLAPLERGSLPRMVRVYGVVRAALSGRESVAAPLSARVLRVFVRRGEEVGKGAALIRLEPSPQVAAAYAEAVSALRVAKELERRTRTMVTGHLATAGELAKAEKAQADARSVLSALEAEGASGPRTLSAPYRAIVIQVATSAGAIVQQGAALVDLARPTRLVLEAGAIAASAAQVRTHDPAQILALGGGDAAEGRVLSVASLVDPGSGLVPLAIALPEGRFLPGERAEARIATGKVSGYLLPHSAILVDDKGRPYAVEAFHRVAKKVPLKILAEEGVRDVVEGPFDSGASLVLAGDYQLENGMRVRVEGAHPKIHR